MVGRGAFAYCFKGQVRCGVPAIIKVPTKADGIWQIEREIGILSKLNHRNSKRLVDLTAKP